MQLQYQNATSISKFNIGHRTSHIGHRTSHIGHPTSHIDHPSDRPSVITRGRAYTRLTLLLPIPSLSYRQYTIHVYGLCPCSGTCIQRALFLLQKVPTLAIRISIRTIMLLAHHEASHSALVQLALKTLCVSVKNPAKYQEFLILEIRGFPNGDADPDRYRLGSATQATNTLSGAPRGPEQALFLNPPTAPVHCLIYEVHCLL